MWCKPKNKDYEIACKVLKDIGIGWFVEEKVNTHTISAHVREQDAQGIELPEKFYEVFDVNDTYSIRSRKA